MLDAKVRDAKFLSEIAAVALTVGPDGATPDGLSIVSIAPRAFDAEQLRKTHARLLAVYPAARRKHASSRPFDLGNFYLRLTTALEDAGVTGIVGKSQGRGFPLRHARRHTQRLWVLAQQDR